MSEVFVLTDSYEGTTRIFKSRKEARVALVALRNRLHQTYCVDKRVPVKCSCGTERVKECASHAYARTVLPHTVHECLIANDNIEIETKEVE
jgi:hypothetical protein